MMKQKMALARGIMALRYTVGMAKTYRGAFTLPHPSMLRIKKFIF